MYFAPPVTLSGPSTRGRGLPITEWAIEVPAITILRGQTLLESSRSEIPSQRFALALTCHCLQRMHQATLGQLDLEAVFALWLGVAERRVGRLLERRRLAGCPSSAASASGERQGFVPTPPSAMRAWSIFPPFKRMITAAEESANSYDARSRSFRYNDLAPAAGGGNVTCVIRSPGSSTVSRCGVSPGSRKNSPMGMLPSSFDAVNVDRRFKSHHRHVHIRGIGGDAMFARPQDRQRAIGAGDCRATRARLALIAGQKRIAEIDAAGALQKIAGRRGHVAQLGRAPDKIACDKTAKSRWTTA